MEMNYPGKNSLLLSITNFCFNILFTQSRKFYIIKTIQEVLLPADKISEPRSKVIDLIVIL